MAMIFLALKETTMIKEIEVFSGQTVFDVAIQEYGEIEQSLGLLNDNGLSLDDVLPKSIKVDTDNVSRDDIVFYLSQYSRNGEKPNTDVTTSDTSNDIQPQGIGFWAIKQNFIVS